MHKRHSERSPAACIVVATPSRHDMPAPLGTSLGLPCEERRRSFKKSRSERSWAFSRCRRRNSSSGSRMRPFPGKAVSASTATWSFHRRSTVAWTPSSRATSANRRPASSWRTASNLNSRLNFRRVAPIRHLPVPQSERDLTGCPLFRGKIMVNVWCGRDIAVPCATTCSRLPIWARSRSPWSPV